MHSPFQNTQCFIKALAKKKREKRERTQNSLNSFKLFSVTGEALVCVMTTKAMHPTALPSNLNVSVQDENSNLSYLSYHSK